LLKKYVAILLLSVYLLSTTEAHQLLKLPYIFKHYAEHHQENDQISFLDFLDMHYMHGSPHDADYAEDMQLPFKSTDKCTFSLAPAYMPAFVVTISHNKAIELKTPRVFVYKQVFITSPSLSGIWQPPRSC